MLDLVISGATVVDGTGAPSRRADVGVRDGIVVAVGEVGEPARRVIDATDLVVTPGFVDIHTHYDAQVLWDGAATPSPLHGTTTIIGGNCGFSIAPLVDTEREYVMRMMARVEGIPLTTMQAAPEWTWSSFGEYLDRIEGRMAVNAGFLAGHSTIRRVVMGAAAVETVASDEQIAAMERLLHDALAGGALGFSSGIGDHKDGDGAPVPSRLADAREMIALSAVVRAHHGTTLEFTPGVRRLEDERVELMIDMSSAADRPLNWNLLGGLFATEVYSHQLDAYETARTRGGHLIALTLPDLLRMRDKKVLPAVPGWEGLFSMTPHARRQLLADPVERARIADAGRRIPRGPVGDAIDWDLMEIAEDVEPSCVGLAGRTVGDIARERGVEPIEVVIDHVLPDLVPITRLYPSLVPHLGNTDESWRARVEVWRDHRTVLGGSDAGAHLDIMCHANYPTIVLGETVRRRELWTLEEAVHQMTAVPASLYGLRGRGRVAVGHHADLVVLDPAEIGSSRSYSRNDLPAGQMRVFNEGTGIHHVFVNGQEAVDGGQLTGSTSGTVLRSGRDTETVSARALSAAAR